MSSTSDPGSGGSAEPSTGLKQGQELTLTIEKIAAQGAGMATHEGVPVFVPGAIPGQKVLVMITRNQGSFVEAKLRKVTGKAINEIMPKCKHFWECGGCIWQHLPYEKQILYKEQIVRETLEHVTPVDEKTRKSLPGRVLSIIPSPQIFHYRNKLELSFGYGSMRSEMSGDKKIFFDENPSLGFHQSGQWATILPVEECHLYDEQIAALLSDVKKFMEDNKLQVYNPKTHKGMLRTLLLRRGINTGEQMVCFVVQARKRELEPLFQHFTRFGQRPSVASLLVVENMGKNDSLSSIGMNGGQKGIHVLKGDPSIRERIFDLEFSLSPFSFFQTNTLAAEKLYQVIAQTADLSGRETVLDCYCGLGSIGQYLARFCGKVVGVESSTSAIEDALQSAGKNKIANISFYKGLAEHVMSNQLSAGGKYKFDVVVVDPPRAGLHQKVVKSILEHKPEKIVYVSCNTSTFARDLGAFLDAGYELRLVQPVDLFPHTAHVETVALLQRG